MTQIKLAVKNCKIKQRQKKKDKILSHANSTSGTCQMNNWQMNKSATHKSAQIRFPDTNLCGSKRFTGNQPLTYTNALKKYEDLYTQAFICIILQA